MNKLWWLVFVCAACGDDGRSVKPDAMQAGQDSAMIDAAADCAGAAAVTVVGPSFDPKNDQLTFSLVAHDATGAMCSMKDGSSEPDAHVTIDVPPGGMVTMALNDGKNFRGLFTWTEVQPADELRFPPLLPPGGTKLIDVEVTLPTMPGVQFDVYVQCEYGGGGLGDLASPGTFTKQVECPASSTAVAMMVQGIGDTSTQYAVSAVTPIAPTGATTLTLGTWMPAAAPTVTIHGGADFDRAYATYAPSAGPGYESVTMLASASSVPDPLTLPARAVPPTWRNHISAELSMRGDPGETLQVRRDQTTPASLDVSVATDFLPRVSGQIVAPFPRPSVTWSMSRPATADVVTINAGHWVIVTRAEPGTVRYPEVPSSLLPIDPAEIQAIDLVDLPGISGFDGIRRNPGVVLTAPEFTMSALGESFFGFIP